MEQINIRIWNKENEIIADAQGEKEVALVYKKAYQEGDSEFTTTLSSDDIMRELGL